MKQTFLTLLLMVGFALSGSSQIITNVFWKNRAEDGSGVINYNPSTPLSWSDFKGLARVNTAEAALTTSGFGYDLSMSSEGSKGNINVAVYCFFSKKTSWVKPGQATAYILNHEQRHFDLTYIAANMFYQKMKKADINVSNFDKLVEKLYTETQSWLSDAQKRYDQESKHSILIDEQSRWDADINAQLQIIKAAR